MVQTIRPPPSDFRVPSNSEVLHLLHPSINKTLFFYFLKKFFCLFFLLRKYISLLPWVITFFNFYIFSKYLESYNYRVHLKKKYTCNYSVILLFINMLRYNFTRSTRIHAYNFTDIQLVCNKCQFSIFWHCCMHHRETMNIHVLSLPFRQCKITIPGKNS